MSQSLLERLFLWLVRFVLTYFVFLFLLGTPVALGKLVTGKPWQEIVDPLWLFLLAPAFMALVWMTPDGGKES